MKKKSGHTRVLQVLLLSGLLLSTAGCGKNPEAKGTHYDAVVSSETFTESSRALRNPNRGFYHMNGFVLGDEDTDYREDVARRFCRDEETSLTLIEVNLREYRDRMISEEGLENLRRLFAALEKTGKQMILRFLYDWDGTSLETEPESRETILGHMEQIGPLASEYKDQIFVIQGLFIGNVGEMHGSKYLEPEDTRVLAAKLSEVMAEEIYLAVRTPAHWRRITQTADPGQVRRGDGKLSSRLGLYNDGMLGSGNDTGTYGAGTMEEDGPYVNWKREEELAFQNVLCRQTPLGGEVILDNPYNDLEHALQDLSATHVTYLNWDHDSSVLEKWAASVISEESCYDGMDGLSYIERRLGYRLVLREARLSYLPEKEALQAAVLVQNVGFAPIYKEAAVHIRLYHGESETVLSVPVKQEIRDLAGGMQAEETLLLQTEIPVKGMPPGSWSVYLDVTDRASGQRILFGNEQDPEEYGYRVGRMELTGWSAGREKSRRGDETDGTAD